MRRGGAELCFKVPRDPASKRVHAMHMRALARLETGLGRGGVECGGPFFFPASRSAGMHLLEAPPIRMPGQLLQARLHCWVLRPRARLRLQSLGRCRLGLILWGLRAWGGLTGGKVQANPPTCEEDADAFVQSCRLPSPLPGEARIPGSQTGRRSEQRTTGIFLILTLVVGCGGGPRPFILREQAILGCRGAVVTASVAPLRVCDCGGCPPSGAVSEKMSAPATCSISGAQMGRAF